MQKIFVVLGYGVPKDIMKDANYSRYISFCFNTIYDLAGEEKVSILFCGGKTDCYPPYKRTEAEEMYKLFKSLAQRKFVKEKTRKWKYVKEKRSVCRLENFLYAHEYLIKNKIKEPEVIIFCEYTRAVRATTLVKKIFRGYKSKVLSVDFDLSPNRYLDREFLKNKEDRQMLWALRALQNKNELKKFIQNHKDKLKFFRENDYINNPKVVEKWWFLNSVANNKLSKKIYDRNKISRIPTRRRNIVG